VPFKTATVETSEYTCTVHRTARQSCKVELLIGDDFYNFEDQEEEDGVSYAEDRANFLLTELGSSVFLPTFRRIEGGFTIGPSPPNSSLASRAVRARNEIEDSLSSLSKKLSNRLHIFVASISTVDIVSLLLQQYSNLSDTYAGVQGETSREIIDAIKAFKSDKSDVRQVDLANEVLDSIRTRIEMMEIEREEIMKPIEAVRQLVTSLFQHSGIKIGGRLSFGDAASAVNSDSLSAGEKQMLSFICYNAFYKNAVFLIDEPELSLHVDWQRQLFPILQRQQSSNQFIIATHSPFIYSKYPDKEVPIDLDRGDRSVEDLL
jgi:predicted ATPase